MTPQNVLDNVVRNQLEDPDKTRWADADLLPYILAAQREILKAAPWKLLDSDGDSQGTISDPTALGDTLDLDEDDEAALADYVLYRAFFEDGTDEVNLSRAMAYLNAFRSRFP